MTRLKRLFWNDREQRLRALWRLLLQAGLLLVCVFILGAALALGARAVGVPVAAASAGPGSLSRAALGVLLRVEGPAVRALSEVFLQSL